MHVSKLAIQDMLVDAFGPIIREGSGTLEVSLRLTATLSSLRLNLPDIAAPIRQLADQHRDMVLQTMKDAADRLAFTATYDRLWATDSQA